MLKRLSSAAAPLAICALLVGPAGASAAPVGADERGDAVVVISGDVSVPRGETVAGVFVVSGDVRIDGRVDGDVAVLSGDVLLAGHIDGDLYTASGTARLEPTAAVEGDVGYADNHPEISLDATVGGEIEKGDWPDLGGALAWLGGFLVWLAMSVSLAVLGTLLILVAPRAADSIAARARERAGPTIAIGIAIAIALPLAAVLAAITLVGLPLAFGISLALVPLAAIAYAAAALALGRRIMKPPRGRILAFLAGLAILQVLTLVPLLNFVIGLAATVYGLGLIGAAIGAARNPPEADGARSPDS